MKNKFINSSLIVNLYRDKSLKSSLDTQLIYGENFKIIKKYLRWKKIKISNDGYVGFIKDNKFYKPIKPNFKVNKLKARTAKKPLTGELIQLPVRHKLSFHAGKELRERVNHDIEFIKENEALIDRLHSPEKVIEATMS